MTFNPEIWIAIKRTLKGLDMTFNPEIWIAVASAVVAICALAVTIWQGRQNYKHNKISVRPKLAVSKNLKPTKTKKTVCFELINSGVGPAIIKDFILIYDREEVSKNNYKTYENFLKDKARNAKLVSIGFLSPGVSISIKESFNLFSFQYKHEQDILFVDKLSLRIHYQSIYEDEIFTYYKERTSPLFWSGG